MSRHRACTCPGQNSAISTMFGSLIGYVCAMATACAVFMSILSHFVSPPMFQQPHPGVGARHSHIAVELRKARRALSLDVTPSSAIATEAASPEPQKEK